jgi:hypothetical protein
MSRMATPKRQKVNYCWNLEKEGQGVTTSRGEFFGE